MGTEENYLDSLLKSISEPRGEKSTDDGRTDGEIALDAPEIPEAEPEVALSAPEMPEAEPEVELSALEVPEMEPEVELPALEMPETEPEIELSDNELSDIELHEVEASAVEIPEAGSGGMEGRLSQDEISNLLSQVLDDVGETESDAASGADSEDIMDAVPADEDDTGIIGDISDISIDGLGEAIQSETETEIAGELNIDELSIDELEQGEDIGVSSDSVQSAAGGLGADEEELNINDVSFDDVKSDENGTDTVKADAGVLDDELNLDDIFASISDEEAPAAEEKPAEVDNEDDDDDDFSVDIPDIETIDINAPLTDGGAELGIDKEDSDDGMDDVLSLLDQEGDLDLTEIKDMLKKDDNHEPLQDDMMDMLSKMADNEKAFVDAGRMEDTDDSDEGAPKPNIDVVKRVENKKAERAEAEAEKTKKGKKKKASKKKKKGDNEAEEEAIAATEEKTEKKPGVMGKFFNMLTEDLVPEPTEEELEAEKAAKEAKKQENLTKKEEEKAAKEEAKKAKAEEKEAAKKAKAAEAEQKKKEKKAAKEAKLAAKRAKEAAKPPIKRIPPKKLMAGALFGATVFAAIMIATNILSEQGYIQKAKRAYYNGDYMTAYQATYGMKLNSSDDIIKGSSAAILKMERKYDSYKNNMKIGRELEALDALVSSFLTYDYINTDAEQYGVLDEVNAIKDEILNILSSDYGLDEAAARELLLIEDPLSYSMALNDIINNKP